MPSPSLPVVAGRFVLVTAPTSRCGTTLVQRLLGSSPDALVLGEPVGLALVEHVEALARRAKLLARADEHRADLARALSGAQFWAPHLLGDVEGFVELIRAALERFVAHFSAAAEHHGRRGWGAKLPTVAPDTLRGLRAHCPDSRVVYVVRDLVPAARSAKARRFLRTPADFERFAELWRTGVAALGELGADPGVLVVDHAALERRDPRVVAALADFTGFDRLDPSVLATRINTWTGSSEQGHAPDGYVAPAELDAEERAILARARG